MHQRVERRRHGERRTRLRRDAEPRELTRELERIERVASRRVVDARQHRARNPEVEPLVEQLEQSTHRQRTNGVDDETIAGELGEQ